jgi:hypothetical protein
MNMVLAGCVGRFERFSWLALLGVSVIIGLFGVGDMLGGAADLQNGETVMMHSLTGLSWNELQAVSPGAANLIDLKFRTDGAALATLALLSAAICLTGWRRGERWAWYVLWAIPAWMALTALFTWSAVKHPEYGTPIPVISGAIFLVLWVTVLALSYRRFFRA